MAVLRPWLATLPPDRPVFDLPEKTAEMLRADLDAAGIPYETSDGGRRLPLPPHRLRDVPGGGRVRR